MQHRIEGSAQVKTFHISQDNPANALVINKDNNHVTIAGRNIFKVFSIEEDGFIEKINLRVGKNLNLNFSCNDVAWSLHDDNLLATAATNGAVVLWNLNKISRSKHDAVFQDHKRTVNKVNFHCNEPHVLLSGSQDGTMKYFDIRKLEAVTTFYRDVQFNNNNSFQFSAVMENGTVQLWDIRRTDRFEKSFSAHSGPVFSCDWHPEIKCLLATAGRDKCIKIWDVTSKPLTLHTVLTIASVGLIRWRPQKKNQIVSSALVVDCNINIWDICRPFVPLASFREHKDVTTGIAWRGDPDILLSTSKDCTTYQHSFRDAVWHKSVPVGFATNVKGEYCIAFKKYWPSETTNVKSSGYNIFSSVMLAYSNISTSGSTWFYQSAQNYMLIGNSLTDICDHNSALASRFNQHQIWITWQILKHIYCPIPVISSSINFIDGGPELNEQKTPCHFSSYDRESKEKGNNKLTRYDANDSDIDYSDQNERSLKTLSNIASGFTRNQDFYFGESNFDTVPIDNEAEIMNSEKWVLHDEAFDLKHEIEGRTPPPEKFSATFFQNDSNSEVTNGEMGLIEDHKLLKNISVPDAPLYDFTENIIDMLHYYVDKGEIQTVVTILIVIGDRIRYCIPEHIQEHWCLSYIETLHQLQLWNVSNLVISLSQLPLVNQLNQQSTVFHINCPHCKRNLPHQSWYCNHCHKITNTCSVCHQKVHGLYAWCKGCGHGGHLIHLQDWMEKQPECPTGCGHLCSLTC